MAADLSVLAPSDRSSDHDPVIPRDVNFDCTMCGRCCHGLRLPLSVDESIDWIDRGGVVEVLCDAGPVPPSEDYGPSRASYQSDRTIPGMSGSMPLQVSVTLVATFSGPCPFLLPDMRCGNYDARPRVCRVYPAEANPFLILDPAAKACPSEAWEPTQPILMRDDLVVDPSLRSAIAGMRQAGPDDVAAKAHLCGLLGINVAAFANEGLVAHTSPQKDLRAALGAVRQPSAAREGSQTWHIATNRATMRDMLRDAGCTTASVSDAYIAFFPTEGDEV